MHATDFGGGHEMLCLASEQQQGGVGGLPAMKQTQMGEHIGHRRAFRQRKLAGAAGAAHEGSDPLQINVIERGIMSGSIFKQAVLKDTTVFEIFDQAGEQRGGKIGDSSEPTADQL